MVLVNRTTYLSCYQVPEKALKELPTQVNFLGQCLPREIFMRILACLDKTGRRRATLVNKACYEPGGILEQHQLVCRIRNLRNCLHFNPWLPKEAADVKKKDYKNAVEKILELPVSHCFHKYQHCLSDVCNLPEVFAGNSNSQVIGTVLSILRFKGFQNYKLQMFSHAFKALSEGKVSYLNSEKLMTVIHLNEILGKGLEKEIESISQLEDVEDKNVQAQFLCFLLVKQHLELKLQDATLLNQALNLMSFMDSQGLEFFLASGLWEWKGEKELDISQYISCVKRLHGKELSILSGFTIRLNRYGHFFEASLLKMMIYELLEKNMRHKATTFKNTENDSFIAFLRTRPLGWEPLFDSEEIQRIEDLETRIREERFKLR